MAAPLGIPCRQMSSGGTLWPETVSGAVTTSSSMTGRFTKDNCMQQGLSLDTNGTVRDSFAPYINGNGVAVSSNGKHNGLEAQLHAVTSQENYTHPSRSCAAEVQVNRCVNYLPTSDSGVVRMMDCDSDVIHSSFTDFIARMPFADKYKFLNHLIADKEKVYTVDSSLDDPTMGVEQMCSFELTENGSDEMLLGLLNCEENGSLQSVYTTTGQSNSRQPKQTSVDAVTLNGWCQDFGVTSDRCYDLCPTTSSSSLNCFTSDTVIGFDDSLFLAQPNDISDLKTLVDDL